MSKKDDKYWEAFAGRMVAFRLGNAVIRGIGITGREEELKRLNEFLRAEMPELRNDDDAKKYLDDYRERMLSKKPVLEYPKIDFRMAVELP